MSIEQLLEPLERVALYFPDRLEEDRLRFLLLPSQAFAFVSNLEVGTHSSSVVLPELGRI